MDYIGALVKSCGSFGAPFLPASALIFDPVPLRGAGEG